MTRGYYSLIQYCPDPSRLEAANIGVLLYCPDKGYFDLRMSTYASRVQKFFGQKNVPAERLSQLRLNIERRLREASKSFDGVASLREFASREANEVQITEPRPVAVELPGTVLTELFETLVEPAKKKRAGNIHQRLDEEFKKPKYDGLIAHQISVPAPAFGEISLVMPYGYLNGCYNLIQPATFPNDTGADLVGRTGRFLYQGQIVQEAAMRLVVVGDFPARAKETAAHVGAILRQRQIRFYTADDLDKLTDTILETAKPIAGRLSTDE